MKTALALVAVVALATTSIACSSPTQGNPQDVDTGSALSALQSPTGSFSAETAGKAFGGYRGARADSSKISTRSTGSSGAGNVKTGSRTIKLLDRAASSEACGQGQACACPNGGSMSFSAESSAEGQLVRITFDSCGFEDGFGFDGKAILLASTKSLLGLSGEKASTSKKPSSGAPSDSSDSSDYGDSSDGLQEADDSSLGGSASGTGSQYAALLLAAKGTASKGGQKLPLEFALLTEAQYSFLAVSVPDGKIVIGVSDDGRAIVKSKEGTWNCHSSSKGWSCTSDKGKSMDVTEEVATEGASASNDESSEPTKSTSDSEGDDSPAPSGS